jgi:peptidoglycan-associated lipoprotein
VVNEKHKRIGGKIMTKIIFSLLTVLTVILSLASCGSMNKNRTAKGAGGMEQEWVTEGRTGPEGVKWESGDASNYSMETDDEGNARFRDILFDYDKYTIRKDARPILNSAASVLSENTDRDIIIEGHTDERGTNEYNLALGEKRARATMKYLRSLGVSPERVTIMTFGEERPLCTSHNETCWQRNRRAFLR